MTSNQLSANTFRFNLLIIYNLFYNLRLNLLIMPQKKCVLICDDDTGILEACKMILSDDYRVETAEKCLNIIEEVGKVQPDIILMDIRIPGGGERAVNLIHESEEFSNIPVIVFSALSDIREISERVNATAVIEKPFGINTLLETIQENIL